MDGLTLDQLRVLVAVADEGSFSAAGRALRRVQSAVSHAVAGLEGQLGVTLWDRSTRVPTLTEPGRAVLAAARRVLADVDTLRRLAAGLATGLEASVGLCVDAIFPVTALVELCREFAQAYPAVALRVHTETMSAVAERVLDGTCQLGVVGPTGLLAGLEHVHLAAVRMVPVVGAGHPLAGRRGAIATEVLADELQIVLAERGASRAPDTAVLSRQTWRVVDLATKHELLRAGLGWGNLPEHMIRDDVRRGQLIVIRPAAWGSDEHLLSLSLVHRPGASFGPAARWLIPRLGELCQREVGAAPPPRAPARARPRRARGTKTSR